MPRSATSPATPRAWGHARARAFVLVTPSSLFRFARPCLVAAFASGWRLALGCQCLLCSGDVGNAVWTGLATHQSCLPLHSQSYRLGMVGGDETAGTVRAMAECMGQQCGCNVRMGPRSACCCAAVHSATVNTERARSEQPTAPQRGLGRPHLRLGGRRPVGEVPSSRVRTSDFRLQSSEFRVARLAGLSPQYHSKHGASTERAHTAPPERGLRRPQRRLGSGSMESVGEFPSSELAARADCARVLLCLRILHNTAGSRAFTMGRLSPS